MNQYFDVVIRINIITGEIKYMGKSNTKTNEKINKEILNFYKKMNIEYDKYSRENDFIKYTIYDYSEKGYLTTKTNAKI